MTIPSGLAAELDLLTQALDLPDTDIAQALTLLCTAAQAAVDSYLGLSVVINVDRSGFDLTVLEDGAQREHVRTSLLAPLSPADSDTTTAPAAIALILYAATPGAFRGLAADLSWITGRSWTDYRLDEHLTVPADDSSPAPLAAASAINQALGVLIGRGSTPEQAELDLHARAVAGDIDPAVVAIEILAALRPSLPESELS